MTTYTQPVEIKLQPSELTRKRVREDVKPIKLIKTAGGNWITIAEMELLKHHGCILYDLCS